MNCLNKLKKFYSINYFSGITFCIYRFQNSSAEVVLTAEFKRKIRYTDIFRITMLIGLGLCMMNGYTYCMSASQKADFLSSMEQMAVSSNEYQMKYI